MLSWPRVMQRAALEAEDAAEVAEEAAEGTEEK